MATPRRLAWALSFFVVVVLAAIFFGLMTGYQSIEWSELRTDETARTIFFRLRVPRVTLGLIVGGSLAGVGAALQALFRNPEAELSGRASPSRSDSARAWPGFLSSSCSRSRARSRSSPSCTASPRRARW